MEEYGGWKKKCNWGMRCYHAILEEVINPWKSKIDLFYSSGRKFDDFWTISKKISSPVSYFVKKKKTHCIYFQIVLDIYKV